jgi:hypothetical protein
LPQFAASQAARWVNWAFGQRRRDAMKPPDECLTLAALFAQPDNAGVLRHLRLHRPEDVRHFEAGTDGSPFDEGGQVFFHRYGRLVPAAARYSLELCNVLAHEHTARVFALHQGRFTIALRPDISRGGLDLCSPLRGETLDGPVDLTQLGPGWVLFSADGDEEAQEAFLGAYELAGRG